MKKPMILKCKCGQKVERYKKIPYAVCFDCEKEYHRKYTKSHTKKKKK